MSVCLVLALILVAKNWENFSLKRHITEILSHFWYRKLAQNLTDKMTNDKFQTTDSLFFGV